jgi:hypothetical protein
MAVRVGRANAKAGNAAARIANPTRKGQASDNAIFTLTQIASWLPEATTL